jgi:hypothetical protein
VRCAARRLSTRPDLSDNTDVSHLNDIRLSRLGAAILAAVSLAATIVILAGGGDKTSVLLAAEASARHRPHVVEEVEPSGSTVTVTRPSGGSDPSPPASDPGGSGGSGGSGASSGSGSSASPGGVGAGSADSGGGGAGAGSAGAGSDGAGTTSGQSTSTAASTTTTPADAGLPKVGHVFLLTLSTPNYRTAFGARSAAPYLRTLARRGTVLSGYHALGSTGLVDRLAAISGQPPNADTAAGCRRYAPFPAAATLSTSGVAKGTGCVYPDAALTVADQLTAAGKRWGAYVEGMGADNCSVPSTGEPLDTPLDGTQAGYDVAHNPFAFFGSLLDAGGCSEHDEDLSHLPKALARRSATPALTYLAGNACVDADPTPASATTTTATTAGTTTLSTTAPGATAPGATAPGATTPGATMVGATTPGATTVGATTPGTTPAGATTAGASTAATTTVTGVDGTVTTTPATTSTVSATTTSTLPARLIAPAAYGCPAGESSGMAAENAFLSTWVPKILASAAYRANGVLVIAFTGAGGRETADTGALVLSRWTPKAKRITTSYDAYSLLHSIEDMLDLAPLARAAGAPAFATLVLH